MKAEGVKRFKRYPAYKDSGVERLGEIPEHWKVKRLKFVAPARITTLDAKPDDAPYVGLEQVESWTGRLLLDNQPESVDSVVTSFKAGDVLLGKLRPYLAKVARPQFEGVSTSEILALRPTAESFQSYVMYCLLNAPYIRWLDSLTYGTKMPRVRPEQVGDGPIPVPPAVEQRAIAAFLDRETARIDALVAKKERLIKLLQEKRTALITRVVTKGLDPSVPMKDSGIEWLGEIPAHWEVKRLRHLLCRIEQGWSPECENREAGEDEWGVLKAGCVNRGSFVESEHKALPPRLEPIPELEIVEGDLLMSRASGSRELVGSVAFVPRCRSRLLLCDKVFRLHTSSGATDRHFLAYSMNSRIARWQIELVLSGGSGLANNIAQQVVKDLMLVEPRLEEQRAIAAHLDRETARIDALVAKVHDAIARLRELRTALISAAVTGKIDVRTEAA
jgi:type I restriction enzyme S subunit